MNRQTICQLKQLIGRGRLKGLLNCTWWLAISELQQWSVLGYVLFNLFTYVMGKVKERHHEICR